MRVTIRPKAIILTKAQRAVVSIMSKGRIMARVLPLRVFLFSLRNECTIKALKMHYCKGYDKKEVLLHEYSQSVIIHAPHFRRVLNHPLN